MSLGNIAKNAADLGKLGKADVAVTAATGGPMAFARKLAERVGEQSTVGAGLNCRTRRRPSPQWISLRRFDFDDVGATVGEQLGAVGARDPGGQVDHGDTGERRLRHYRPDPAAIA